MARRIYYVVSDDEDDWGVRLNDGPVEGHADHDVALKRAVDAAAADKAEGHDAQVQIQTPLGFERHDRYGARLA